MLALNGDDQLIAEGDEFGNICVWRSDIEEKNTPFVILKYSGQVYDVEFIITNKTKLLLSLHQGMTDMKSTLIVTDLVSRRAIMTIPMDIHCRKICVHPNNRNVSVISIKQDFNKVELVISLVF